jgi:hypothetical protein
MYMLVSILLAALLAATPAMAGGQWDRPALLAGQWYPESGEELSTSVGRFLSQAKHPEAAGRVVAIITPHAGHVYSGQVAAAAWRMAGRIKPAVRTVVLLGPAHRHPLSRPSIWAQGSYGSPLGPVAVDAALAAALRQAIPNEFVRRAHLSEHCLEVQVPFIRQALPQAKIVPILTGGPDLAQAKELGHALAQAARGRPVLLAASTDLSHFHTQAEALVLDGRVAARVAALDPEGLWQEAAADKAEACGLTALAAVMFAARELGASHGVVLDQATSARVTGENNRVVGYLAAALVAQEKSGQAQAGQEKPYTLSPAQKELLRDLAWRSVRAAVRGEELPEPPADQAWLKDEGRVFVTLRGRGRLRGCIGNPMGGRGLGRAVVDMARAAARQDPRFPPVSPAELDGLELEISVLTPPRPTTAEQVLVGRDGLLIRLGGRAGLLLPQVPTEQGWGKQEFLEGICRKAGLPVDAWKHEDCRLFSFQALVF